MTEQEKREAVKNHLNVREVTQALPKEIQDLVSTWFLQPPTYMKMLEHWPNLDHAA